MKSFLRRLSALTLATGLAVGSAPSDAAVLNEALTSLQAPFAGETGGAAEEEPRFVQGGCSGAAAQAAARTGGQVLSVTTSQKGGRTVCVVTVLIPGKDGGRPRRQTITVPQ